MADRHPSITDSRESRRISAASIGTDDAVSMEVVTCVANATGTDPLELPPLYESIDPEALDRFVESVSSSTASVTFSYAEHTV